jgi:hypothetical protein
MLTEVTPTTIPQGKIKSFDPLGPKYEIGSIVHTLADGDWMVEVTSVDSGEKTEYRLTHLRNDPEAHSCTRKHHPKGVTQAYAGVRATYV